jgi:hypothetical protein
MEIQAKGMQHIRNLKKVANMLHKEYSNEPGMYLDCVEAACLQHRVKCLRQQKLEEQNGIESGNPS